MMHLLFGGTKTAPQEHKCYRVNLRSLDDTYACNFVAFHQDAICQNILQPVKGKRQKELRQKAINLSDIGTDKQPISIFIGADILGKVPDERQEDTALMISAMFSSEASPENMWSLDVLGIEDPQFKKTTRINSAEKYEVILPWKENHPPLYENREVAEKRLENTLKRLRDQNLLYEYEKIFDEWLKEDIIEVVPEAETSNSSFYLPHRPFIKEGSTTRIRPVFDASVQGKDQPSLNQCLETGPNLIELISSLLLRFRENKIGLIADIRKTFLQISVAFKERDVMRFLWKRSQGPDEFVIYRHCRVVFGIASNPFLLGATIDLHLKQTLKETEDTHEKSIIQKLKRSFYVDNCVTSTHSEEEAILFKEKATSILAKGGFDLRGWQYSNKLGPNKEIPVLGLFWNVREDMLMLSPTTLSQKTPVKVTKREILSFTQKIFDPLGVTCRVQLKPKLLLKRLWNKNTDWDVEVENNDKEAFQQWQQELEHLRHLKIPRWALKNSETLSLHLFVDASQTAYGAVIFARIEHNSEIEVHFIQAKSRIAPKEKATIPRLELLSASIGARLMNNVVNALKNPEIKQYS
ncbi:uncharacterized protein [Mycetomoellerius zeteki]|uniref:uncharacterized protein n=1 Tax=Mycetomoellerius zeteki TaxID=64791 RepID=UPI00084EC470|nr:PREDICTED: uncharacterized protein LOC108722744 [Trachymyrmex zeteki]